MNLPGLAYINLELSSKCNKNCWCCGRRKIEKDHPEVKEQWGFIDLELLYKIADEIPNNIVMIFHWDGEPLLYPKLGKALKIFKEQIRVLDTNGKLLVEKTKDIIGNLDTLTLSVIEQDSEAEEQYNIFKEFMKIKGNEKPRVIIRCLGNINTILRMRYEDTGCLIANRILHNPMGSFDYKGDPTIPEDGICHDFLNHLAIHTNGDVSICARFDPERVGVIGNIKEQTLEEIWNSPKRMEWMRYHLEGRRNKIPLCSKCDFWGVPTST